MSTSNAKLATPEAIRETVRERYAEAATRKAPCCGDTPSCETKAASEKIGYSSETLDSVPEDANLGLGCGNPTALASIQPGETVVDLGSGAGLDGLIAAKAVGPTGRIIGVDMTPEMLKSARENAVKMGVHGYVEFREGLIEYLPVNSETADLLISNCVINLSPDKTRVFSEAFRVLKSGGRVAVSDVVLSEPLPKDVTEMVEAYVGCLAGASTEDEYLGMMKDVGFTDIEFTRVPAKSMLMGASDNPIIKKSIEALGEERVREFESTVWSYKVTARKP